jgi:hypothetical protein
MDAGTQKTSERGSHASPICVKQLDSPLAPKTAMGSVSITSGEFVAVRFGQQNQRFLQHPQ